MAYYQIQNVELPSAESPRLSLAQQLQSARNYSQKGISAFVIPEVIDQHNTVATTEFHENSKGRAKNRIYVNPFDATVTGTINQKDTFMYKVRKLHGELLLNKPGTLLIELVGSWFIVLILTGLYVWWPRKKIQAAGYVTIRRKSGGKAFRRDMHVVLSFWLSLVLLIIVGGGMPWTEVFGSQLKWLQVKTDTGYPKTWNKANELRSIIPASSDDGTLSIDELVNRVQKLHLKGQVTVNFAKNKQATVRVANKAFWLSDQKVIYLDQYSGEVVKFHTWKDVGFLMDLRQVLMKIHQGQYGLVNWLLLLFSVQIFIVSSFSALVSYLRRKPENSWGLPSVPVSFRVNFLLLLIIAVLAIVLPMFGLSIVVLLLLTQLKKLSPKH